MRIRNSAALLALAVFVLTVRLVGLHEACLHLLARTVVCAVSFAFFALQMIGGGDVKMVGALMLLVPSGTYTLFGMVFSATLMLVILAVVGLRARGTFPMSLTFGLARVTHLCALAFLA